MGGGAEDASDTKRPPQVRGTDYDEDGVPDEPKREPAGAPMAGATVDVWDTDVVAVGEPVGP